MQRKVLQFYHRKLVSFGGHNGAKLLRDMVLLQVAPRHYEHFQHLFSRRQRGRVVRTPDLKALDPEFKSRSDQLLNLFQVVPGSTARPRIHRAN